MILRLLASLLAGAIIGLIAWTMAHAHPGRVGKDGCHVTRAPYEYANGTRLPADFYHCHRALDTKGVPLDGTQVLDDNGPLDPRRTVTQVPDGRFFICETDGRDNRECGVFDNALDSPFHHLGH